MYIYFDAASGVSGDMFVGTMLDLGADFAKVRADISALGLAGVDISAKKITRGGITCTKFDVIENISDQPHRHLSDIKAIINNSAIDVNIKNHAIAIFELLAAAEAKAHDTDVESVHFHEVGAVDSIVDIVAAVSGFLQFGVSSAACSPINIGSGTVKCAHGVIPVPAPATLELLKGMVFYTDGTNTELATPTGVAILKHFCSSYGVLPDTAPTAVGYGGGTKELKHPNVLKAGVYNTDFVSR